MNTKMPYTSSIKDMPFLFFEMRRTAQLMRDGKTKADILELSLQKNIYQLEKERRRKDLPLRMLKRLENLSEGLLEIVANGRESDAKLIALLALLKADRLFFEYMHEVYANKFLSGQTEISDKDFISFIEQKAQNDEKVSKWTTSNLMQIRGAYKSILCEVGLAKKDGQQLIILRPICDPEIQSLFNEEDKKYARTMLLEV